MSLRGCQLIRELADVTRFYMSSSYASLCLERFFCCDLDFSLSTLFATHSVLHTVLPVICLDVIAAPASLEHSYLSVQECSLSYRAHSSHWNTQCVCVMVVEVADAVITQPSHSHKFQESFESSSHFTSSIRNRKSHTHTEQRKIFDG